jgi:hypothetical protein
VHSCWCILLFECGLNSNLHLNSNLFELEIEEKKFWKRKTSQNPKPRPSQHSTDPLLPLLSPRPSPSRPSAAQVSPSLPCGPHLSLLAQFLSSRASSPRRSPFLRTARPALTSRSPRARAQLARPVCLPAGPASQPLSPARSPRSAAPRALPLTSGAHPSAPSPSPRRAQQSPNPRRGFRRPPLSGAHAQASPSRPTNSAPRPWFSNPPHTRRPQTLAAAGRSASSAAAGKSLGRRFASLGADPAPLTRCTASQRHPEPVRGDLGTGGVRHPPGPRAPISGFPQTRRRRLCSNPIDPS